MEQSVKYKFFAIKGIKSAWENKQGNERVEQ